MTRFSEEWYARRIGAALQAVSEPPIVKRAKPVPKGEPVFPGQCKAAGYPRPEVEYAFHPVRKWRFDYAWPHHGRIALEVEGGIWTGGAHAQPIGIERDMEKYNAAALLGWRVLRYQPADLALAIIDMRGLFNREP